MHRSPRKKTRTEVLIDGVIITSFRTAPLYQLLTSLGYKVKTTGLYDVAVHENHWANKANIYHSEQLASKVRWRPPQDPLIPVNSVVLRYPPLSANQCQWLRGKSSDATTGFCQAPSSPPSALSWPHDLTTLVGSCWRHLHPLMPPGRRSPRNLLLWRKACGSRPRGIVGLSFSSTTHHQFAWAREFHHLLCH